MIWPEAEGHILSLFDTQWANRTSVKFPNAEDELFPPPDSATWISITPIYKGSKPTLGMIKKYQHNGFILFTIYAQKGSGTGDFSDYALEVSKIFRDKIVNNIRFSRVEVNLSGQAYSDVKTAYTEVEDYVSYSFVIPFYFEEVGPA